MRRALLPGLVLAALTATACGGGEVSEPAAAGTPTEATTPTETPSATPTAAEPEPTPEPTPTGAAAMSDAELAEMGANELGRVLVMEWHEIQDEDGRWSNSLSTFRSQLQELYDKGYRPISLSEFIDGTFDIPAGTSPVLLTFDDSYKEHMFFGEDGAPHPDSVPGIMQAMHDNDPTWRPRAVFAFYWPVPFRETDRALIEEKLNWLVDNGYDLSNHTYNHDNLQEMSDAEVIDNLARHEAETAQVVGDDYRIRSITLTQGIWPQNPETAMSGEANGFRYEHDVAFEVGFMPTRSPHHAEYDPWSVQRVQAYVPEFRKWMDWLDEEPGRRFISDGDPATVTYPKSFEEVAAPQDGFEVRVYDDGSSADGSPE